MADTHFKPIGGMFQGVRGSTVASDGIPDAKKLVMLNEEGIIDDSCLSSNIRDAGNLADALDAETEERQEKDEELENSITALGETVSLNNQTLTTRIDSLDTSLSGEIRAIQTDIEGITSSLNTATGNIRDLTSTVEGHSAEISLLSSGIDSLGNSVSQINVSVLNLGNRVDAVEASVSSMSGDLERNNRLLNQVSQQLEQTSITLLDLTTRLVTDEQAIKTVQEYIVAKMNSVDSRFDSVDIRLSEIERILGINIPS